MVNIKAKYIQMLKMEFEELSENIELLIDESIEKEKDGKITKYVSKGNVAVLKNEITTIKEFIQDIESIDVSNYENEADMLIDIQNMFIQEFKKHGFSKISVIMLTKRIEKIKKYILE